MVQSAVQGVNSSCVVVVSCCAADGSVDCVSIVISESTRAASLKTRKGKVDVWVIIFFYCV